MNKAPIIFNFLHGIIVYFNTKLRTGFSPFEQFECVSLPISSSGQKRASAHLAIFNRESLFKKDGSLPLRSEAQRCIPHATPHGPIAPPRFGEQRRTPRATTLQGTTVHAACHPYHQAPSARFGAYAHSNREDKRAQDDWSGADQRHSRICGVRSLAVRQAHCRTAPKTEEGSQMGAFQYIA